MVKKKEVAVIPPEKELKEYKSQVTFVQKAANDLVISSNEDMEKGTDLLNAVKQIKTAITERKEQITRPLMTALASARDLFKPLETGHAEAEKTIKAKMLAFSESEQTRIDTDKDRIQKRVEKGTMKVETALDKLENLGEVGKSFSGDSGKVSIRVIRKVRVVDETLLPREYLVPDLKKITQDALQGKLIPGIDIYEEKVVAAGSR